MSMLFLLFKTKYLNYGTGYCPCLSLYTNKTVATSLYNDGSQAQLRSVSYFHTTLSLFCKLRSTLHAP